MKGAKPFVPRHIYGAIIAIKVPVMKLMVEMAKCQTFFILHQEGVEPSMAEHRSQRESVEVKNDMHRMRRHD